MKTKIKYMVILLIALSSICCTIYASPIISIQTYEEWSSEIGPMGHITPIPSWSSGGFESVYPGESSAFRIPTLTALSNEEGEAALELDFGTGPEDELVIGGIQYEFGLDPDYTGGKATFSVRKRGTNEKPGRYSLHLRDSSGRTCNWVFDIPQQQGASDPWEDVTIDFATTPVEPLGSVTGGFDISKVVLVSWDYRGTRGTSGSFKGKLDHIKVVPEPCSVLLLGAGMLGLVQKKR
jgi:hypothetical protein